MATIWKLGCRGHHQDHVCRGDTAGLGCDPEAAYLSPRSDHQMGPSRLPKKQELILKKQDKRPFRLFHLLS